MPTSDATLDLGHRYRLLSAIGAGGMGAVYHARDRLTGHDVALKRLVWQRSFESVSRGSSMAFAMTQAPTPEPLDGTVPAVESADTVSPAPRALRLALSQEFQILSSLHHPHVISVLDYGFDKSFQPYYVMELLSGAQTLCQHAAQRSEEEKLELLSQVAQALLYLHRRGVLHREFAHPNSVRVTRGFRKREMSGKWRTAA